MPEYQKIGKKTMPPIDNHSCFILWQGTNESDGGMATVAKRCKYGDNPPYIRYLSWKGWKVLPKSHYKTCLWAPLDMPEQVKKKMERTAIRMRERERRAKKKESA